MAQLVGASSRKPKDHGFNSRSGHILMLQVQVPGWGAYERQQIDVSLLHQYFSSLSLSLPLSLKSVSMFLGEDKNDFFKRKMVRDSRGSWEPDFKGLSKHLNTGTERAWAKCRRIELCSLNILVGEMPLTKREKC